VKGEARRVTRAAIRYDLFGPYNVIGADRIHVLKGGAIVESGTHEQLLSRGGTCRCLFEAQAPHYQPPDPASRTTAP
jgi:hypothetical protein